MGVTAEEEDVTVVVFNRFWIPGFFCNWKPAALSVSVFCAGIEIRNWHAGEVF